MSLNLQRIDSQLYNRTSIISNHSGRSVSPKKHKSINSEIISDQVKNTKNVFDSENYSRSLSMKNMESDSKFDMISSTERECLFHVNVVMNFKFFFEKCHNNPTLCEKFLETFHQKISTQKALWISTDLSESITDLYLLEELREFYLVCENRWKFF